jgi:hypothetical protein
MAKTVKIPASAEMHLDADTLAAFAEQALPEREIMAMFAHLASCEHCRERLRVQSQLRSLEEAQLPDASQQSAWFLASPFRKAAGFVFAVLSGAMLLWWSHFPRPPFALLRAGTNHLPQKMSPTSRRTLVPHSVPAGGEGRFRANAPTQNEMFRLTREITSDTQEGRSAGQSRSSNSVRRLKRKEQTAAYSSPQSGILRKTVRFQPAALHLIFHSEPVVASLLPRPFVTARLNQQLNFGPVFRDDREKHQMQGAYSIAVGTALGERRFCWNGFADKIRGESVSLPSVNPGWTIMLSGNDCDGAAFRPEPSQRLF